MLLEPRHDGIDDLTDGGVTAHIFDAECGQLLVAFACCVVH
jgi:hypothetical protein